MKYPKRLIEVDLPVARLSAHARQEKSIRNRCSSAVCSCWGRYMRLIACAVESGAKGARLYVNYKHRSESCG